MIWFSGQKLQDGKFTIEKELGTGRFGTTYLARHKDGDPLVIKTLSDDILQSTSPEQLHKLLNDFVQEAGKLSKCRHPNIVKAGLPFLEGDRHCIAMEYIGGRSLAERDERILPESIALQYIKQVGEALIEVHKNDLVHRDVKPDNILLRSRDGKSEAVLIDFGLALESNRELTTVRTQQASEGYAPPELYSRHGKKIGPYTDVYSLAATLYDLLTGRPPVSALNRMAEGTKLIPPIGLNDKISPNVSQQIVKALELEPGERPKSIYEWLVSLELITEPDSSPIQNPSPDPKPIDWKWVVATAIALIAALGGLVGGMAGWIPFFNKPSSSPSPAPSASSLPSSKP
jgi:eukaryotic-like serine/threonine-protein kinase